MRYLILGPLEVREGGTEVELRGGQQRKLLAILLLHSGEAVSSDRLIEELWDGKPPGTAAKALQGYVSSLRKQLGPETVETVGAGYRLTGAGDTDARRFEELLAEARPLEHVPAAEKLREAAALWRGPALADFAYDDFARNEIDRLDELRLGGIERRIELELALGHHDDLVPELDALVHAYPLRERLRGYLMVALYRSGRQAEALDVYRDARAALRDELGLEPSEELQALQRSILDHDDALAAPPRIEVPGATGRSRSDDGRRLRRPLLAVAIGLALLGGAAAALVLTRGNDKVVVAVPKNSVAKLDRAGTRIQNAQQVGRNPTAIAVGLRGVWVANSGSGTVSRLDPATGNPTVDPIGTTGGDVNDIAVGFGSVWVANGNDGTVTEINPLTDQTAGPAIQLGRSTLAPDPVFYIAVDLHHVWATRGNRLLRIDPGTRHYAVWANVGNPTGLTTGGGYVWVTTQSHQLLKIDPQTPNKPERHPVPAAPSEPVYWRRSLWLIEGDGENEIQQIHPTTLQAGSAFHLTHWPALLAAGTGALWVVTYDDNNLSRLLRLTRVAPNGRRTTTVRAGKNLSLSAVAAAGAATWLAVSPTG